MSGGGPGQVAPIDPGVAFLCPSNDEHRQGAVVRPIDPVATVGHDQALAAGDRSRVHRNPVDVGRCRR